MCVSVSCDVFFNRRHKLTKNRAAKQRQRKSEKAFADQQHNRRMQEYPTLAYRKFNENDFVAHPSLLLRKSPKKEKHSGFGLQETHKQLVVQHPFNPKDRWAFTANYDHGAYYDELTRAGLTTTEASKHTTYQAVKAQENEQNELRNSLNAFNVEYAEAIQSSSSLLCSPTPRGRARIDDIDPSLASPARSRPQTATTRNKSRKSSPRKSPRKSTGRPTSAKSGRSSKIIAPQSRPSGNTGKKSQWNGPQRLDENDPYDQLKMKLFQLIIDHRIYTDENLRLLFEKAEVMNANLDQVRLQTVLGQLKDELGYVETRRTR